MRIHCPYCKKQLKDMLIEFRASDNWHYDEKQKKWNPGFSFMPDQGECKTKCRSCRRTMRFPSIDPNDINQEELNGMN